MSKSFQAGMRASEIKLSIKAILLGLFIAEIGFLTSAIAYKIIDYVHANHWQNYVILTYLALTLIIPLCFLTSGSHLYTLKLLKSKRFDLLILIVVGSLISYSYGGIGSAKYYEYIKKIPATTLILISYAPFIIGILYMLKTFFVNPRTRNASPFFISDVEIQEDEEDLLNVKEKAQQFAERVLNGGSSDSLVFGIDAPWGVGKSSFINICCNHWKSKNDPEIIIHRFEPLRYEDGADLANKFIDDLVNTIQAHVFAPTIRPLFSKYTHQIKAASESSFLGFSFQSSEQPIEKILQNLNDLLLELDKKIIIVVDDLDRLSWSAIKNILFAVKRSFMLPNISYVLCYDTDNIITNENRLGDDADKVKEFLEKFVNVKISLYIDSNTLKNYVTENFEKAVKNNLHIDPSTLEQIKQMTLPRNLYHL